MFCKNCGRTMNEGDMFCPECGKPVDETVIFVKQDHGKDILTGTEGMIVAGESRPESKLASVIKEEEAERQRTVKKKDNPEDAVKSPDMVENLADFVFCPNCGAKNESGDAFCYSCGSPLSGRVQLQPKRSQAESGYARSVRFSGQDVKIEKIHRKARKGKGAQGGNRIIIAISAIVIILLILCIALAVSVIGGMGSKDLVLYLKDNELMQYAGKQVLSLDDDILDSNFEKEWGEMFLYKRPVQSTEDKSLIYYPRNYTSNGFDLYRIKSAAKEDSGEKVDSNVVEYELLDNGNVIYIKDYSEKKMYLYDGDQSTKIASGVSDFIISEDEKILLWEVDDTDGYSKIYYSKSDWTDDNEKIASDALILCCSDTLDEIFYEKGDALYLVKEFADPVKIASNVDRTMFVKTNGECTVYYIKEGEEMSFRDFFEDNYYESDKRISEPDITDYQHEETKDSYWGPITETVTEDAYFDKSQEYDEKQYRDQIREYLQNKTMQMENLYLINTKGEGVIAESGGLSKSFFKSPRYIIVIIRVRI